MRYTVIPHGIIISGFINLEIDHVTGAIDFNESVVVGWSIFTKTLANHKTAKIDPAMLLSKSVSVGLAVQFGPVSMKVSSIERGIASVDVTLHDNDNDLKGSAYLDLTMEYFKLTHLIASGVSSGTKVTLEIQLEV